MPPQDPQPGQIFPDPRTGRPRIVKTFDAATGQGTFESEDQPPPAGLQTAGTARNRAQLRRFGGEPPFPVVTGAEGEEISFLPTLPPPGGEPPPEVRPDILTGEPLPRETPLSPVEAMVARDVPPSVGPPGFVQQFATAAVSEFDPRTPGGRANLAGTTGAIAADVVTRHLIAAPAGPGGETAATVVTAIRLGQRASRFARSAATISGAGVGGGAAAVGEEIFGAEEDRDPLLNAFGRGAAEQAAYEAGGQAFMFPIKFFGRRFAGISVAGQVPKALQIRAEAGEAITANIKRQAAVVQAKLKRTAARLRFARQRLIVKEGAAVSETAIAAADAAATQGQAGIAAVARQADVLGAGITATPTSAGTAVGDVLQGPAKQVRTELGDAIQVIAEQEGPLPTAGLKAQAQTVFDRQIKDLVESFSGAPPNPEAAALTQQIFSRGATEAEQAGFVQRLVDAGIDPSRAEATIETARHPVMGLLRQFINAPDEVPFAAFHRLKLQLREPLSRADFAGTAQTQARQLAKKFSGALDAVMDESSEAYRLANEALAPVIQLMEGPTAKRFLAAAQNNPERLVARLKPDNLTEVQIWRDLLLDVAPKAGPPGAQAGQVAWDGLVSAWSKRHLLQGTGGIAKLTERLNSLPDDFAQVLYEGPRGQAVLNNFRQIGAAQDLAVARAEQLSRTAAARGGAEGALAAEEIASRTRATREAGEDLLTEGRQRAQKDLDIATEERDILVQEARDFTESTVAGLSLNSILPDIMKVVILGPQTRWGAFSMVRLLRGPKGVDLARWAALSNENTQLLVRALHSPKPGAALADLVRASPAIAGFLMDKTVHSFDRWVERSEAREATGAPPSGASPPP